MRKNHLTVRGLSTPRLFLWLHGWIHGHVLKSGGINPETGIISSCYITGKCSLFHEACISRVETLERTLQKDWSDADNLLVDYADLCSALSSSLSETSTTTTDSASARANEQAASARAAKENRRQGILKQLLAITNHIHSEEDLVSDQMEATAERLKSMFVAYGHGLVMRPIYPSNLPSLSFMESFTGYHNTHAITMEALGKISATVKEAI